MLYLIDSRALTTLVLAAPGDANTPDRLTAMRIITFLAHERVSECRDSASTSTTTRSR